jgi:hypothetical protein
VNASHFHSYQDAYEVARNGDVIQIEPGASAASVGKNVVGTSLAGGLAGTQMIIVNNLSIKAGEWVDINDGVNDDQDFVTAAEITNSYLRLPGASTGPAMMLTLERPFSSTYNYGATVTTLGELGSAKAITLQGDPIKGLGRVASDFLVPPPLPGFSAGSAPSRLTFKRLQFGQHRLDLQPGANGVIITGCSMAEVELEPGAHGDVVTKSAIWRLFEDVGAPGSGNGDNLFSHNHLGTAVINGDGEEGGNLGGDQILDNIFAGATDAAGDTAQFGLYMISNSNAVVDGNTFTMTDHYQGSGFGAIVVFNSESVKISNNTITLTQGDELATGISLSASAVLSSSATYAEVENNVISTAGAGTGLAVEGGGSLAASARVQGNDFRHNAIGVAIWSLAGGTVDLGGGPLYSLGENNFSDFTPQRVAAGDFAISLHDPAATVDAYHNFWHNVTVSPLQFDPGWVVRDGSHNTTAAENAVDPNTGGPSNGSGTILLPLSQLTFYPATISSARAAASSGQAVADAFVHLDPDI